MGSDRREWGKKLVLIPPNKFHELFLLTLVTGLQLPYYSAGSRRRYLMLDFLRVTSTTKKTFSNVNSLHFMANY